MKKFNFMKKHKNNDNKKYAKKRINQENAKSKKKVNKKLRNKLSNLEIKPQFLIIGLVAIITIIIISPVGTSLRIR